VWEELTLLISAENHTWSAFMPLCGRRFNGDAAIIS